MTSPDIQKDIVNSYSKEMVKAIIEDLNGNFFVILVDESKDVSHKEQMALVLRYVNKEGSYKRREMLRYDQAENLDELLLLGEFFMYLEFMQMRVKIISRKHWQKWQLQIMRTSKWDSLMEDDSSFCDKNGIMIPKMDENHLSEVNIDLLLDMASLSPDDSFSSYDKKKIMKRATYYPNKFTASKLEDLSCELDNYIDYVREMDNAFSNLKGLGDLTKTLVKINIHKTWGLVYLLVNLSLILPVACEVALVMTF
ncbi:uncharacterized protein [Nicotiana sylvestris]|uniref:uncharacterized protein n=1 Tax=Nicotiana sylvestris TaxID=4096 RepID=UPI00388C3FEC